MISSHFVCPPTHRMLVLYMDRRKNLPRTLLPIEEDLYPPNDFNSVCQSMITSPHQILSLTWTWRTWWTAILFTAKKSLITRKIIARWNKKYWPPNKLRPPKKIILLPTKILMRPLKAAIFDCLHPLKLYCLNFADLLN